MNDLLNDVRKLGKTHRERAEAMLASPYKPTDRLTTSAVAMWFSNKAVPQRWRMAALERTGKLPGRAGPQAVTAARG